MRSDVHRRRWLKPLLLGILIGWLALHTLLITMAVFDRPKVLFTSKQPGSIHYGSFEPYYLIIIERTDWNPLLSPILFPSKRHEVFICTQPGATGSGHGVDFTFYTTEGAQSRDKAIRRTRVQWSQNGVRMTSAIGDELFVPKKLFLGGR